MRSQKAKHLIMKCGALYKKRDIVENVRTKVREYKDYIYIPDLALAK